MAEQIASLGVAIDSSSARAAVEDLRRFAEQSARAEGAQRDLADATEAGMAIVRRGWRDNSDFNKAVIARHNAERAAASAIRDRGAAEREAGSAASRATAQLEQTNRTVDHLGVRTESSARSYGAMVAAIMRGDLQQANASLATLASRMAVIPALTTPAGAAIAGLTVAVGALAAITVKGALEADKFNRLILATGERAGQTAGSLMSMRNELGRATGDYAGATEALTELVRWGRVSGDEFRAMGAAAVIWGENTGRSASEVVKQLTALGEGGTDSLLALNNAYGFLTPATFRYIEAVRQQDGDMAAMRATMAQVEIATASLEVQTDDTRGVVVRSWSAMTTAAKGYLRAVLDIGRRDDDYLIEKAEKRLAAAQRRQREAEEGFYGRKVNMAAFTDEVDAAEAELAQHREQRDRNEARREAEATRRQLDAEAVRAQARVQARAAEQDEEKKHGAAIAKIRQDYLAMFRAEDWEGLDALDVKFKVSADGNEIEFSGGQYAKDVAAATESRKKLTDAEREANRVSKEQETTFARLSKQAEAYASELALTAETGDKLTKVERFIKVTRDQMAAGTVNLTGAMREQLTAQLADLEASERQRKATVAHNEELARAVELRSRLAESLETATAAAEREVAAVGMSRRERELANELDKIANEVLRERKRIIKELGGEEAKHHAEYMARMAEVDEFERRRTELAVQTAARRTAAEGDWRNGARRAMMDIRDANMEYAKTSETVVTDAYGAMTNAIMTFSRTGKFEIKDMTIAILESMMKMAAQIAASQILMSIVGAFMPSATSYTSVSQGGSAVYGGYAGSMRVARGGVFSAGQAVSAFAKGGVVDRATPFGMAGGRTGVMGEEGAEAIMPLGRDSSGRLGVRMVGGEAGGGGIVVNAITNVNVDSSGNATTTSTATTGSDQQQGRALGVLLTERVKAILVEQSRPGGLLWGMQNG